MIIMITLQPVLALADTASAHQDIHMDMHSERDHHGEAELALLSGHMLASDNGTLANSTSIEDHADAEHPDCHQSHCHHTAIVYLEINTATLCAIRTFIAATNLEDSFNSTLVSPNLRPPIV